MHPHREIPCRPSLCTFWPTDPSYTPRVTDDFGALVPSDSICRTRFIYDTLWACTPDEHEHQAAQWAEWEADLKADLSSRPAPRPHSVCTLLPGDSEAIVQTAAELIVGRVGEDPPDEPMYRLNLRGEPCVYITRSDLLALMTGAAELLQLDLQPRVAPAEEAVLA